MARTAKRIKPTPKPGKYLYEYQFQLNDNGQITDFIVKNKWYICYRNGLYTYCKDKNPHSRMEQIDNDWIKNMNEACFKKKYPPYGILLFHSFTSYTHAEIQTYLDWNAPDAMMQELHKQMLVIDKAIFHVEKAYSKLHQCENSAIHRFKEKLDELRELKVSIEAEIHEKKQR